MEPTPQPTAAPSPIPPSSPGMFGTKIPSTVAFAIGILVFFLPFAEIKCGGSKFAENTGLGIAIGQEWKTSSSGNGLFGNMGNKTEADKETKKDPNIYAIAALGLGVLGLLLSFANAKSAAGAAMVTGILSAVALIGLMLDLKKEVKGEGGSEPKSSDMFGLDKLNDARMTIEFTPWFYIALFAFLAAAFFCYKRMSSARKIQAPIAL